MNTKTSLLISLFLASCEAKSTASITTLMQPGGPLDAPKVRAKALQEKTRPVFSLFDNRHLAHWQSDNALFIPMSGPSLAKYLHFARPELNWRLSQTKEGKKGAAPLNKQAALSVPLTKEQIGSKELFVHVYSPNSRKLNLKVNGKVSGSTSLDAGWQTVSVPLQHLSEGENKLNFELSAYDSVVFSWVQLGGASPSEAPSLVDTKERAFTLNKESGAAFYVQLPEKGYFTADVLGDKCELDLRVTPHSGATITGSLHGADAWFDLSAASGSVARLEMRAKNCPTLSLKNASLSVVGEAKKVEKPKSPKYIVLWVMDTLRGDKLRIINPDARPEIPVFEEMAKSAAVFTSAYSQGNESRAGHASIWTSLYPVNHRMIGSKSKLAPELITLDEAMKSAGFFTSGVSCNGYIRDSWGFGNTWNKYRNHIHDGGGVGGADVMGAAIKSVKDKVGTPFFLYIGTIDTHVSWRAHEPWLSKYDPEPYEGPWKKIITGKSVEDAASGKMKITKRDKERALAFYDANVSYQDELVGKFLQQLKDWGIADETMIVFTADHGEEMWEEGRQSHGATQLETLVHVPLIVYYPPLFPGGKIIEGVDTMDIIPTMLDAMNKEIPESMQGESLIALSQGVTQGYPRPAFSSMYERQHTMRLGTWKMDVTKSGEVSLFDLASKEREKKSVLAERPLESRFMTDAMSTFLMYQKQWKKWKWGVASNVTAQFSSDLE